MARGEATSSQQGGETPGRQFVQHWLHCTLALCSPATQEAPRQQQPTHPAVRGWQGCCQSGQHSAGGPAGEGQRPAINREATVPQNSSQLCTLRHTRRMPAACRVVLRPSAPHRQQGLPQHTRTPHNDPTCPRRSVADSSTPSASSSAAMQPSCPFQGLQARCSGVAPALSGMTQAPRASSTRTACSSPFMAASASGVLPQRSKVRVQEGFGTLVRHGRLVHGLKQVRDGILACTEHPHPVPLKPAAAW